MREVEALSKRWDCKSCEQMFARDKGEIGGTAGKEKMIFLGAKFRHILNSFGKVFVMVWITYSNVYYLRITQLIVINMRLTQYTSFMDIIKMT